jgi:hypothetical protein
MSNEFADFDKETPWFLAASKSEYLTGLTTEDELDGGISRSLTVSATVGIIAYIATNAYNSRNTN